MMLTQRIVVSWDESVWCSVNRAQSSGEETKLVSKAAGTEPLINLVIYKTCIRFVTFFSV